MLQNTECGCVNFKIHEMYALPFLIELKEC
jgi:hypothetical protein